MSELLPGIWVDQAEELESVAARVAVASRVALDTEANSLYVYRERTCIVQLTIPGPSGDLTWILDALALPNLGPLRSALDRPDVELLVHGGDYDVTILTRDHDFRFHRLFDTMIAATLLGLPKVGLADLVLERCGVVLDKRFQKADWSKRPVTPEQLEYLAHDTQYLPPLHGWLSQALIAADLEDEAGIEFARLARRRGEAHAVDPEGWRRLTGAATLGPAQSSALRALHLWRETEAARQDVPPFKVLAPQAMVPLCRSGRVPSKAEDLSLQGPIKRRYGDAILQALTQGIEAAGRGELPPPPPRPERPDPAVRKRHEAVKAWRNAEAALRKVPNVVVLPNPGMDWVARQPGRILLQDLAEHPDIGPKRAARYGAAIQRALMG